jgi:hypothetical protein
MSTSLPTQPRPGGLVRSLRPRPPHISLWALWSAASESNALDPAEVRQVVKDLGVSCASPWSYQDGHISMERFQQGVEQLFSVCPETAALAIGTDFLPAAVRQRGWFHSSLAYCPACLGHGYHCLVFQHRALRRCPLHGTNLRYACESCGLPLPTSFQGAAAIPFGCPHCGRGLAARASEPLLSHDEIARRIGASRHALVSTLTTDVEANGSLCLVPHKAHPRPSVVLARRAARFCNWVDDDPNVLSSPRPTEHLPLSDRVDEPDTVCVSQHVTYLDWLQSTSARFPAHADRSTLIVQRLQWNPNDPAIGEPTTIGAIAFGRLRFLYGGIPAEGVASRLKRNARQSGSHTRLTSLVPFAQRGMVAWSSRRANSVLLRSELDGMLAWLAIDTRHRVLRAGSRAIVWHAEPDATVVAPAWRFVTENHQPRMVFRRAINEETVDRLLFRSGNALVDLPSLHWRGSPEGVS